MNEYKFLNLQKVQSVGGAMVLMLVVSGCSLTPEQLSIGEIKSFSQLDQQKIQSEQDPISGAITLEEAIARAIKYNLNQRLSAMEEALNQNELTGAKIGLLPMLTTAAGYSWRSNPDSSNSQTEGGTESTSFSYSDPQRSWASNLTMSWNILDFGVSYFQAKQQGNRSLIAHERKRRTLHNLIMETRTVYWRAAAAAIMSDRVNEAAVKARRALKQMQTMLAQRLDEPLNIYRAQKSLVETIALLDNTRASLDSAKPKLAALMNLRPGTDFQLAVSPKDTYKAPVFPLKLADMEIIALTYRPELRESEYETRISVDETKKTFARMFPGIELSFGRNHTTSRYKNHPAWSNAGMQITWNLLNLLSIPNRLERTDVQENIALTKRMALHLAVLTQVNVSYRDFYTNVRQYEYSKRLWVLDQMIKRNTSKNYANKMESLLEELRAEVNMVQTELQFFDAYAVAQNGVGRLYASLGLDPLPQTMNDLSIDSLSIEIKNSLDAWASGKFPWNNTNVPEGLTSSDEPLVLAKGVSDIPVQPIEKEKSDNLIVSAWTWIRHKISATAPEQ